MPSSPPSCHPTTAGENPSLLKGFWVTWNPWACWDSSLPLRPLALEPAAPSCKPCRVAQPVRPGPGWQWTLPSTCLQAARRCRPLRLCGVDESLLGSSISFPPVVNRPELLLKGALYEPHWAPPTTFYADGIRLKGNRGHLRVKQAEEMLARGMIFPKVSAWGWAGWMQRRGQTFVSTYSRR